MDLAISRDDAISDVAEMLDLYSMQMYVGLVVDQSLIYRTVRLSEIQRLQAARQMVD